MRKHALRFAVASLSFALGVTSNLLLSTPDDAPVAVPEPPISFQFVLPPADQSKTCEVHGVAMHLECVPRTSLYRSTTVSQGPEDTIFPNSTFTIFPNSTFWPRHLVEARCKVSDKEVGVVAFICPACRKAQLKWEQGK
jgi:hypothetical protein